jgi:hypothetical protein
VHERETKCCCAGVENRGRSGAKVIDLRWLSGDARIIGREKLSVLKVFWKRCKLSTKATTGVKKFKFRKPWKDHRQCSDLVLVRRRRRNPSFTIRGRTRFFSLSAWNKEKQRRREQQACFSSVSRLKKQKLQRRQKNGDQVCSKQLYDLDQA